MVRRRLTVSHQLNGVIESDVAVVVTPTEDSAGEHKDQYQDDVLLLLLLLLLPSVQLPPAGVCCDSQGADSGQVSHGCLGQDRGSVRLVIMTGVTCRSLGGRVS